MYLYMIINNMNCNKQDHWQNIIIFGECWGTCGLLKDNDFVSSGLATKEEAERLEREAETQAKLDMLDEPSDREKADFYEWVEDEQAKSRLNKN
jgi:hypothetical protein